MITAFTLADGPSKMNVHQLGSPPDQYPCSVQRSDGQHSPAHRRQPSARRAARTCVSTPVVFAVQRMTTASQDARTGETVAVHLGLGTALDTISKDYRNQSSIDSCARKRMAESAGVPMTRPRGSFGASMPPDAARVSSIEQNTHVDSLVSSAPKGMLCSS
jgi:hypothetical protein